MGIMLITHDLGVVAEIQKCAIKQQFMYCGRIIENVLQRLFYILRCILIRKHCWKQFPLFQHVIHLLGDCVQLQIQGTQDRGCPSQLKMSWTSHNQSYTQSQKKGQYWLRINSYFLLLQFSSFFGLYPILCTKFASISPFIYFNSVFLKFKHSLLNLNTK